VSWFRLRGPSLWIDEERDEVPVISDQADWDETAFTLDERGRELIAQTISIPSTKRWSFARLTKVAGVGGPGACG